MYWERSIWLSLLVPTVIGSLAVALCAWWALGGAAAVFVLGACLTCTVGCGMMIVRNARDAGVQLRRPELRGTGSRATGIYQNVLEEALGLLEHCEHEVRESARLKTELEARTQVRGKQVRQLESALNCVEQPLLITDTRDRVKFCNDAARQLFRDADRRAGGFDSADDLQVGRIPVLAQLLEETRTRNAATDRRTAEFELELDAGPAAYRATATNISDDDGKPLGVATVFCDIGDERQEKARHAEFVSSVCHELKTPMAGIKAFTEMLIDGDVTEPGERQELYGYIDVQVDRLTRLVNNMLNLARIESGVIKVQREDCELNTVLSKALEVVEPAANEKQIRLIPELSELYVPVHVDTDLFGQAVVNLLSNAVKYTPEGGEVRLRSRIDERRAVIEVRDNGMGIPAESLPHIFERFYRVPQNNKAAAGTGLGLSLVAYIVEELHNGEITVESEVDRGTCFTATIPLGHRNPLRHKPEPALCAT